MVKALELIAKLHFPFTLPTSLQISLQTSLHASLQTSAFTLQTSAFTLQSSQPIIVKLVEPPKDPTGLAGVLIGALGLTGAITLIAIVFGAVTAVIIFWVRSRRSA